MTGMVSGEVVVENHAFRVNQGGVVEVFAESREATRAKREVLHSYSSSARMSCLGTDGECNTVLHLFSSNSFLAEFYQKALKKPLPNGTCMYK